MIIAITGNIGSGKTTATAIFEREGFLVINADQVGHELYKKKEIKGRVINEFGLSILTEGNIDRQKLKRIVFYDHRKLKRLNEIMHPEIIKEIERIIEESKENVVIDGALIIEAGFKRYDKLLLITINHEEQRNRLIKKGKYKTDELDHIIKLQMSQEDKKKYADYIIDNSGSIHDLNHKIEEIIRELK